MSDVLKNATAHFRNKISGDMMSISVPEWGDAKIWFKQTSTLKEEGKLIELTQKGSTVEALVETLIQKARNEDGTKMFKPADKTVFLNEVDPQVLIRVIGDINAASADGDIEEVSKN
jgi:hypothetical protein